MKHFYNPTFLLLFIYSCSALQQQYQPCGGPGYDRQTECESGLKCFEIDKNSLRLCLKECEFGLGWKCQTDLMRAYKPLDESFDCKFRIGRFYNGQNVDYSHYDYFQLEIPDPTNIGSKFDRNIEGKVLQTAVNLNKYVVFRAAVIDAGLRSEWNLTDQGDIQGANFIRSKRSYILDKYTELATNASEYLGRNSESLWFIEKNFWSYFENGATQLKGRILGNDLRNLFEEIVTRIKNVLPNAKISLEMNEMFNENRAKAYWSVFSNSTINRLNYIHLSDHSTFNSEFVSWDTKTLKWKFLQTLTNRKIIASAKFDRDYYYYASIYLSKARIGVIGLGFNSISQKSIDAIDNVRHAIPYLCYRDGTDVPLNLI